MGCYQRIGGARCECKVDAKGAFPRNLTGPRSAHSFGLECSDQLEWRNWTPGTEYSKSYVLKNVSTNVLNITYKQTASKAFSMEFPELFRLRPGMSCPLKVRQCGCCCARHAC